MQFQTDFFQIQNNFSVSNLFFSVIFFYFFQQISWSKFSSIHKHIFSKKRDSKTSASLTITFICILASSQCPTQLTLESEACSGHSSICPLTKGHAECVSPTSRYFRVHLLPLTSTLQLPLTQRFKSRWRKSAWKASGGSVLLTIYHEARMHVCNFFKNPSNGLTVSHSSKCLK